MTLSPGTRLNTYEIIGPLGAGGMGEVYRARDTKLDREVAIKLVLEVFAGDRDRAARFEREAKALAALNHPNIATLYGLEHADGRHFLVMELVEGETLGERIARKPGGLPLEDALQIARQIAEALEAAHEKGVVHRDLKPANVKITPDDKVKVLDFGLAKVAARDDGAGMSPSMSPTISALGTQAGMIMGTASYMSPEQARGYTADHRSDVFAFGIVLYEMLTGRQPFPGETISDVLASVLARDPDLAVLPSDLSPRLIDLVKRCLEKNPKRRWQAMGDVRYEVETLMLNPRAVAAVPVQQIVHVNRPLWRRVLPTAAAVLLTALIVAIAAWASRPAPPAATLVHFAVEHLDAQVLSAGSKVAISPDGSRLAYVAGRQLWVRSMGSVDIKPVLSAPSSASVVNVTFSPDGQWLVYSNPQDIFRVPSTGGQPVRVHAPGKVPLGLTWNGDSLLMALGNKIVRVGANGGEPETLVEVPDGTLVVRPQLLPDGRTLLFGVFAPTTQTRPIPDFVVQRIGDEKRTVLVANADDVWFAAPGHLLFAREGVLYATAFNPTSLEVSKDAVPVLPGVRRNGPWAQYALADNGTLAYVAGPLEVISAPVRSLILAGRDGTLEYLRPAAGNYSEPRMSPDRRYLAYVNQEETSTSIWVYDLKNAGAARRLTFDGKDRAPVWTPDSTRVTFQSERNGTTAIYVQQADGRGVAEPLTTAEAGVTHTPQAWSPDGKVLLVDVLDKNRHTLMMMRSGETPLVPFAQVSSISETGAVFSPDGRWVAYTRDENGAPAMVFVQPFPATGALFQISKSNEDGHHPIWSRDGKEILYTPGPSGVAVAVPITLSPDFVPGEPVQLPRPYTNLSPANPRSYDAAEAGKILGLTSVTRDAATAQPGPAPAARRSESIHIVLNWLEELRVKVPIK